MIKASVPAQATSGLARRLEAHARQRGEKRGSQLARSLRETGHRWRSAAALWPDI